jgi:hypothetical protein
MVKNQLVRALVSLLILSSCGSMKKTAMTITAEAIYDSTDKLKSENNLENFEKGILGTIYLMEGMTQVIPENEELLVSLVKAYSGYAYIVHETSYLEESLSKKDMGSTKRILENYTKALRHGLKFLETQKITLNDLKGNINSEKGISGLLEAKLNKKDKMQLEGVLYTAYSMASLMNYQKSTLSLMAYLPIAKGMFDWVCKISPDLGEGICDIFYGAYYSSRPPSLGGNPKLGKKHFEDLIKKSPYHWLGRVAFIQYNLIPLHDKAGYLVQKDNLEKAIALNEEDLIWSPRGLKEPAVFANEQLRLYQAVGIKRFVIIKKHEKELF